MAYVVQPEFRYCCCIGRLHRKDVLYPSMKALISDQLLRHSAIDVKVSVASCTSELTRITAPEVPYNDDHMKEIFQLTLMALEKLSDKDSCGYSKALHILNNMANARSCLLMLDLEYDQLIVNMFQQFLSTISMAAATFLKSAVDEEDDEDDHTTSFTKSQSVYRISYLPKAHFPLNSLQKGEVQMESAKKLKIAPHSCSLLYFLLKAAAPSGAGASENRKQCLKVLQLWLERKILPGPCLQHYVDYFRVINDDACARSFNRHPSQVEWDVDDPLRQIDGMLVSEYGSNAGVSFGFFPKGRCSDGICQDFENSAAKQFSPPSPLDSPLLTTLLPSSPMPPRPRLSSPSPTPPSSTSSTTRMCPPHPPPP